MRRRTVLLAIVGIAGLIGFVLGQLGLQRPAGIVRAEGPFWRAVDARGAVILLHADTAAKEGHTPRVVLSRGVTVDLGPALAGGARLDGVSIRIARLDEDANVDLCFEDAAGNLDVFRLTDPSSYGLAFLREEAGHRPALLARRADVDAAGPLYREMEVSVARTELPDGTGRGLAGSVDGVLLLEVSRPRPEPVRVFVRAERGTFDVRGLEIRARRGGEDVTLTDDFAALPRPPAARIVAFALGAALLVLALAALWLRVLCVRPVPRGVLVEALLWQIAPAAAVCAIARPGVGALVGLLVCGSIGALVRLRGCLAVAPEPGRADAARAVAGLALLAVPCGFLLWQHRAAQIAPLEAERRIAANLHPAPPFDLATSRMLDASNAVSVHETYRDVDVEATFAMEPDAILLLRLRGNGNEGIELLLSGDAGQATGFACATSDAYDWTGTSVAEPLAPSRRHEVRVEARGTHVRAILDGAEVAAADVPLFPSGEVVALALTQRVWLESLRVRSVDGAPLPATLTVERMEAALGPPLACVLVGFLLAYFLRRPFAQGLALGAFASASLSVGLLLLPGDAQPLALPAALACAAGTTFLVFLPALLGVRRASVLRFYGAFLLAIGAGAAVFLVLRHRAWPATVDRVNAITAAEWSGERIAPELLHATHPLLRRFDTYLRQHEFRGRTISLEKPEGVRRIFALGTSSTYGYGVNAAYAVMLEERLNADRVGGAPVEVIVAAVPAATGVRQLVLLENVLLKFEPDLVTLSLYYNDAPALTQDDEPQYLEEITRPDASRSLLDDLRANLRISAGARRYVEWNVRFGREGFDPLREWPESLGRTPPARFEGVLRDFAAVCRAHGIDLVLIQEPVAGDKPRLWKQEFRAAMDRVGAEFGLPVVDPTPALLANGGGSLFMDDVHPYESGHAVIADVLEPVVRAALAKRPR